MRPSLWRSKVSNISSSWTDPGPDRRVLLEDKIREKEEQSISSRVAGCINPRRALKKFPMIGALVFATSKKCTMVDTKPTATIVDNGAFKTWTEAEAGMKTMKVCTTH